MNQSFNTDRQVQEPLRDNRRGCWQKMGKCGKCCIGCTICSVIVAAVLIPVLILVVAPNVAQHILDNTVIALPNVTMMACDTLNAYVINDAELTIPGPLIGSATLHPYTQKVSTTMCDQGNSGGYACDSPNVSEVGTYLQPQMSLSEGLNQKNFSVAMALQSVGIIINGLIAPCFTGYKALLILDAEDISISMGPLKISGLHMHNVVTCSGVEMSPDSQNIPNWVCYPDDPTHAPYAAQYYVLQCEAGQHSLKPSGNRGFSVPGWNTIKAWKTPNMGNMAV